MEANTGQVTNLRSLYHRFEHLTDRRRAKGRGTIDQETSHRLCLLAYQSATLPSKG
jgi:hypothetical protein